MITSFVLQTLSNVYCQILSNQTIDPLTNIHSTIQMAVIFMSSYPQHLMFSYPLGQDLMMILQGHTKGNESDKLLSTPFKGHPLLSSLVQFT